MFGPKGFWSLLQHFSYLFYFNPKDISSDAKSTFTKSQSTKTSHSTTYVTKSVTETSAAEVRITTPMSTSNVFQVAPPMTRARERNGASSDVGNIAGWVFERKKKELNLEMLKHGLKTECRTLEWMRKTFVNYLRTQAAGGLEISPRTSVAKDSPC